MEFLRDYLDFFIFGVLGIMSVVMLWMVIERFLFFKQVNISKYSNIYALEKDLTNNLTMVFTIGANAPYVGLLGTVIGILITFYDMGQSAGDIDAANVMVGLGLALKATALGILVAIPSVMFYNALSRRVDAKKLHWQSLNADKIIAQQNKFTSATNAE